MKGVAKTHATLVTFAIESGHVKEVAKPTQESGPVNLIVYIYKYYMRGNFVWRTIMIDNICAFNFSSKYTAPLLACIRSYSWQIYSN
jgi:hypothetical protein